MNIDISYWRKKGRNLYEYPDNYTPLKTYGMLNKEPLNFIYRYYLCVERTGDLMSYIFYKNLEDTKTSVGLNIYINGYAYTSLGELEALISPMLEELARQTAPATAIIEAKILELCAELADTVRYRLKPLAPLDYSIGDNYSRHFLWGDKEEIDKIVRSTEMGMTLVSFFHFYQHSAPDPEPPIKLDTDTDTDLEEKEENNLPEKEKENKPPKKNGRAERIIPVVIMINITIVFLLIISEMITQ